MIRFGPETCGNVDQALAREWLETNGIGGFASSTITGLNTRRYHGLLTAATKPPLGRFLLLSKIEETLVLAGRRYELGANRFPGAIHPQGHQYLIEFRLDPYPIFRYAVENVELEKSVFLAQGENTVIITYELRGSAAGGRLELRPLIAFRDYHSTTHENGGVNPEVRGEGGVATVQPYAGLPPLHFCHDGGELERTGHWYRNFEYQVERERGLDDREDLFQPFVLRFDLERRPRAVVVASTELRRDRNVDRLRLAEIQRRRRLRPASVPDPLIADLTAAADQFLVARGDQETVIAGYHWFGDWGRDTMIALPGLTLVTRRFDAARRILAEFARHVDRGMLPNRFPDAGEAPEYNTVDATLWFFHAVHEFGRYTGDYIFISDQLYPVLAGIIDWHERGTRYGIKLDDDGLLLAGEPGVQLTWMDAKIGGWVVTARHGKPVEIQALWYNALRVMEQLATRFGDQAAARRYATLAARAKKSFNRLFWNEQAGCLYDVAGDASIRPNQIFAASLPYTMLSREKARRVVDVVERDLLTPYGLRTLAPADPQYRGVYQGGPWERDSAYHQGTVWPWLLGPFFTACRRFRGSVPPEWLEPFRRHLGEAGLGQISEILDGDAPHRPRGCIAQAWSVAELLRAAVEDVFPTQETNK
jgi:predicted glycogen debranching enzyme